MDKAYELKGLVAELKSQGLELAEEGAKSIVVAVFAWLEKSADLSENKYDDLLKVVYPKVKEYALEKADEINPAG